MDRIVSWIVKRVSPDVFADKVRELEILGASSIDWTAIRVGALIDSDKLREFQISLHRPAGHSINTASLAVCCIEVLESGTYVRKAPFAAIL